jgi:nitrogen fixation protein FixH
VATMPSKKEFRFTGWHMLASMIAFFGVIIVVNLFMATLASRSWPGLVVKNSYVASQEYNDQLSQAKVQAQRGWVSHVSYRDGTIEFGLRDRQRAIIELKDVAVFIGRPAFEQQDRRLELSEAGSVYRATGVDLADGVWMLRVDGRTDRATYRRDLRLQVKGGKGQVQ